MIIIAKKINLREITKADLAKMVAWRNKKGIREWFFDQTPLTVEMQRRWYEKYLKKKNDKMFIIETKKKVPIGTISLYNIDEKKQCAEFGRMLIGENRYRGRGLAKEACLILIDYGFNNLGLKKLYLEVFASNESAIKLYKSCGFRKNNNMKRVVFSQGQRHEHNVLTMALLQHKHREISGK